ncbi:MAG: hypothetical protein Q8L48_02745 [Archangium sp.]|nr:hypothetical protein [Archangium sp.]
MQRTVVVALVMAGCAAAPATDAGVPVNHPPRVLSNQPAQRATFYTTTACPSLNPQFRLTVEDLDADPLRSMWIIDPETRSAPFFPSVQGGADTQRVIDAPASLAFKNALANLPAGVHQLSAYVGDADFNEVVDGTVTVVRTEDPRSFDSFTWLLDVEPCP